MDIFQKIDDKIKRLKSQIIKDKKKIKNATDKNLEFTKILERDIDRAETSIRQLEWVLKNM